MEKKILVTYATYYGATGAVAKAIADTIASRGYSVDVLPVKDVQKIDEYQAVVVGSAIRGGRIHEDTFRFIKDHTTELAAVPVAYYVCCMTMGEEEPETRFQAETYLAEVFNKFSDIKPICLGFFGSVYEYKHMEWLSGLLDKAIQTPGHDYQKWETVIHWSDDGTGTD